MANNEEGGGFVTGLLFGGVIGFLVGILTAPRAGGELRAELMERTHHFREQAAIMADQARLRAEGFASDARNRAQHLREQASTVADQARDQAHHLREQAESLTDQARQSAEGFAHEARSRAEQLAAEARHRLGLAHDGEQAGEQVHDEAGAEEPATEESAEEAKQV
jgi:gas vesicle protein